MNLKRCFALSLRAGKGFFCSLHHTVGNNNFPLTIIFIIKAKATQNNPQMPNHMVASKIIPA